MNRLKAGKELKEYREHEVQKYQGIDPILDIKISAPCLDHDHNSGHIRMVLQREVNAFEGKVYNAYRRYIAHLGSGLSLPEVLRRLAAYHERDYSLNPLHPTHKTDDEKRLLRNKRARLKRKKARSI